MCGCGPCWHAQPPLSECACWLNGAGHTHPPPPGVCLSFSFSARGGGIAEVCPFSCQHCHCPPVHIITLRLLAIIIITVDESIAESRCQSMLTKYWPGQRPSSQATCGYFHALVALCQCLPLGNRAVLQGRLFMDACLLRKLRRPSRP